ncbi:hypothetical protein JCM11641_005843 [Rhodosporidiobolus odoratus]
MAADTPASPSPSSPKSSHISWLPSIFRLTIGLVLVQRLHWPSFASLPRIQPCKCYAAPGQEIVYGFRVVSSPEASTRWAIELGRIPDDGLKGKVANSYMGLSDNWLCLRVSDGEETHLVLASLFLANLVTRDEAESILSKGPAQNLTLASSLHRIPSLAALSAAYFAGSSMGTRKLLGQKASEGVILPAAVGSASAAGVALFSSRSTRFSGQLPAAGESKSLATLLSLYAEQTVSVQGIDPFVGLLLADREEKMACDLARVESLPVEACYELPAFHLSPSGSFSAAGTSKPRGMERFDEMILKMREGGPTSLIADGQPRLPPPPTTSLDNSMKLWLALIAFGVHTSSALAQYNNTAHADALEAADNSLLFGSWRPGLYFGLRAKLPSTLMTGLMWWGAQDYQSFNQPRHDCDQRDGLSYTFVEHDGRSAAKEVIKDPKNNVELTVRFLKVPGEDKVGSWAVRIEGKPLDEHRPSRITLLNYIGNDGPLSYLELQNEESAEGLEGPITLTGNTSGLGGYTFRIQDHDSNVAVEAGPHASDFGERVHRTQFVGLPVPHGHVWQAKNAFMNTIMPGSRDLLASYGQQSPPDPAILFGLPNEVRTNAGLYGFQKTYQGRWGVDVLFDTDGSATKLDSEYLPAAFEASSRAYEERFAALFPQVSTFTPAQQAFARAITANLVGGIGYWDGPSIVDRTFSQEWDDDALTKSAPKPELTEPKELFSATPSRSFFPRGFYWDEGFHLALIGAWDNDLALEIFKSWLNLADEDGWIGREQILGDEARSRVPQEFQAQYPSYANPPTLIMGLTGFISRLREAGMSLSSMDEPESFSALSSPATLASLHLKSPALAASYLNSVYPTLKRHYEWFRRTQRGQIRAFGRKSRSRTEAYRWRGRTAEHVLTSGLDDYPRAIPPHLGELHVDLASWMGFFARTMRDVAEFLEEEEDAEEFEEQYEAIVENIDDLHWSEEEGMYCDASIGEDDESYHVCHAGYISLYPFLLQLLPPSSPHLGPVLEILRDPEQLWSPYGIRSLSKSHPLFGKGENYWRGPIWVQMNYLALGALKNVYAKESGPNQIRAAEIYQELRDNVINNVYKEYVRTGSVWEQYDASTGEGKRSDPFTGWTSLVTLIMAEQYY